jgi:hypothetical protein
MFLIILLYFLIMLVYYIITSFRFVISYMSLSKFILFSLLPPKNLKLGDLLVPVNIVVLFLHLLNTLIILLSSNSGSNSCCSTNSAKS